MSGGLFVSGWAGKNSLARPLNDDIELGASGDFKYHLDLKGFASRFDLRKLHSAVKKAGFYELESNLRLQDGSDLNLDATLTPKSPAAEAIKHLHVAFHSNLNTDTNAASGVAVLSAKGELVARGRAAMTKVFSALRTSQEPASADFDELAAVYGEVMKNLEKALEASAEALRC